MFQRYNRKYSTSFIHTACLSYRHQSTVHLKHRKNVCMPISFFVTLLPALSLRSFELSSLCSCNPIPVNHKVINYHFFPAEYGWLRLTLQLDLAQTDRQTERQQNNKLPLSWTGAVSSQLSLLNTRDVCHTREYGNRDFVQKKWRSKSRTFSRIWLYLAYASFRMQRRDKQSYRGQLKYITIDSMIYGNMYIKKQYEITVI